MCHVLLVDQSGRLRVKKALRKKAHKIQPL
jgi:signal recognition particle GTPase